MCPRGDLNTETGAISPDRGNHAIRVTRREQAVLGIQTCVRYLVFCLDELAGYLLCWRLGGAPMGLSRLEACRLSAGCVSIGFMSHLPVSGEQPVVPLPDREPAAIRAAVARLDLAALARFEAGWTAATARARDEYSLLPARYFVEHWFSWVAVARWPELAARLRACERVVAGSPDRAERRAAAVEISQILRQAETISA
jgi:hypothetical protein